MIIILSDIIPSSDIGDARFSPTQGSFRSVQLFGVRTHQVPWCAADILQPVSCKNFLRQSPTGPCHDSAARNRQWCFKQQLLLCPRKQSGMPEYCSCSQPLLRQTLGPSPSAVHLCRRWKHTTILKMVLYVLYVLYQLNVLYVLYALYVLYVLYVLCILYLLFCFRRMVEFDWTPDFIRA